MYGSMFGLPAAKPLTPDVSLALRSNGRVLVPSLSCFELETEIEVPEEEAVTRSFCSHDCSNTFSC